MTQNGYSATSRTHPLLYQVNTKVVLYEWSQELGRATTLDDVPDLFLDRIVELGFQWVWFLGIWQMGPTGRNITLERTNIRKAYGPGLPDVTEEDVTGSPFAIQSYTVSSDFGGDDSLARLRLRLKQRNLRLLLDFVPNHVAIDHPWATSNPEYFVQGTKHDVLKAPQNYIRLKTKGGDADFAHGRDPNFDGWSDTLQLDYRNPALCNAMKEEIASIARRCDGVRCDMAMLLLPEIFERTWGPRKTTFKPLSRSKPKFWSEAIPFSRRSNPDFMFMAEVYWDLEYALQQEGFDYTYDKRLYDRLLEGKAEPVIGHLRAEPDFMRKCVHFLENHDEARAAAEFAEKVRPAAIISFLIPGMSFFYEGQLEGRRSKVAIQLRRRPEEPVDTDLNFFYMRIFDCLKRPEVRNGQWRLWTAYPVSKSDKTYRQYVVFSWSDRNSVLLAVVNYGPLPARCSLDLGGAGLSRNKYILTDLLGDQHHDFDGSSAESSVSFAFRPWGYQLLDVSVAPST